MTELTAASSQAYQLDAMNIVNPGKVSMLLHGRQSRRRKKPEYGKETY